MMPTDLPSVSIFIPTFNDRVDLLPCLESIQQLDYPKEKIEIVVWDNASTDGTGPAVRQLFSEMKNTGWMGLKLVEWEKNEGSYIPYNLVQGRLSSESQYILGLDADVELSRNILIDLVNAAKEDSVAAVGARSVYYYNPDLTSHGAGFVNQSTGFFSEKDQERSIECDYVIGCCWLLDRSVLRLLGGFDPDYYINHWEVDYCLRAKSRGYRIIYEPNAVVRHKIIPNQTLSYERMYYLYRNKLILIRKTFRPSEKWVSLILQIKIGLPKAIYDSFKRNKGFSRTEIVTILKAFRDGWMNRTGKIF